MQLMMIEVPTREIGLDALDRIDDAVTAGTITVDDAALVYRNDKGKVKIYQTNDATPRRGALRGGALGLLVGIVAAPAVLAATAVGAGAGALIGRVRDTGVSDALMREMGELIEGSEAVVLILADDSTSAVVAATLDELAANGAQVRHESIPPEAQDVLRELIALGDQSR